MVDPSQQIEQLIPWVAASVGLAGLVSLAYSAVTTRVNPGRSRRLANMAIFGTGSVAFMLLFGSYLGLLH
jgi:hypothetical protein